MISTARDTSVPTISQIQINTETGPTATAKQAILIKDQQHIASKRKAKQKKNILNKFMKF